MSTITLLGLVNAVLKRAKLIQGSDGEITSLTSHDHIQADVDAIVSITNEVLRLLYQADELPQEITTATFTLVNGTSAYSLASDFETMSGNPVDADNDEILTPYPGGWLAFRETVLDIDDFTGLPRHWMIRLTDGLLQIDTVPTATEAGRVYTYPYTKRIDIDTAAEVFPFSDSVVDSLVPAIAQAYSLDAKERFVNPIFLANMAVAARYLRQERPVRRYGVVRGHGFRHGFPYD